MWGAIQRESKPGTSMDAIHWMGEGEMLGGIWPMGERALSHASYDMAGPARVPKYL